MQGQGTVRDLAWEHSWGTPESGAGKASNIPPGRARDLQAETSWAGSARPNLVTPQFSATLASWTCCRVEGGHQCQRPQVTLSFDHPRRTPAGQPPQYRSPPYRWCGMTLPCLCSSSVGTAGVSGPHWHWAGPGRLNSLQPWQAQPPHGGEAPARAPRLYSLSGHSHQLLGLGCPLWAEPGRRSRALLLVL